LRNPRGVFSLTGGCARLRDLADPSCKGSSLQVTAHRLNGRAIRVLHLRLDSSENRKKKRIVASCARYMRTARYTRLFEDTPAGGVAIGRLVRLQTPSGRGQPVGILELAGEVSAVSKSRLDGDLRD